MTTDAIEKLHKSVISELNKTCGRNGFVYYKDVVIESAILPMVELLNNEWVLTINSCGGHWNSEPLVHYPYVQFHVFANPVTWRSIMINTWRAMVPELGGKLTIYVEDNYKLPKLWPRWSTWRFAPMIDDPIAWEESRNILFRNGKVFRRELDVLIGKTCSALRVEIDRERKKGRLPRHTTSS